MNRRRFLLSSVSFLAAALGQSARAFFLKRGGAPPASATQLAVITLVNLSAATAPAGTPTQTFLCVFKPGDIPAGTAPVFAASGITQPFSAGLQTYWGDSSLKDVTIMLRPTFSMPGSGSQQVTVSKGGSWPYSPAQYASATTTVSGRGLSGDVYNQNIVVTAPPMPGTTQTRGSTLKAWLNGDVNTFGVVKWLDGAAGTGWRISTHMAASQGGAPDGMLVVDHYVLALNNAVGGSGGFRWLGALRQPFYNQSGAANNSPGTWVFFAPPSTSSPAAGLNWSIQPGGSGPITTTPVQWLGSDGQPFDTITFGCPGNGDTSGDNTSSVCTVTSGGGTSNFNMGGGPSSYLPVVLSNISPTPSQTSAWGTSGGGLSSVQSGGFAFLYTNSNNLAGAFSLYSTGQYSAQSAYIFGSSSSPTPFTGTATPAPCLGPFQRLFCATQDALYNYFQGSGSITAETTVHVQIDQTYWQSSQVLPPYNLSVKGGAYGGVLSEYTFTPRWYPYSTGQGTTYQPGTGDHNDIGIVSAVIPNWFYNQTYQSRRLGLISAYSFAQSVTDFIDASSKLRLNLGNPAGPGGGGGYGLAAPASQSISFNPSFLYNWNGFSVPPTTGQAYGLSIGEHEPAYPVGGYLISGGLEFLDMLVDQLQMAALAVGSNRIVGSYQAGISTTLYNGFGPASTGGAEIRTLAWWIRDAVWAAGLYPQDPSANAANPVFTDGTNTAGYLLEAATSSIKWPLLQLQTSAPTIPWTTWSQTNGFWLPWIAFNVTTYGGTPGPGFGINGAAWEFADWTMVYCLAAALVQSTDAQTFISLTAAKQWAYDLQKLGGWLFMSDSNRYGYLGTDDSGQYSGALINSDALYAYPVFPLYSGPYSGHNEVTWGTGNPSFTGTTGYNSNRGWAPSAGDIWVLQQGVLSSANDIKPAALSYLTPYYVRDLTIGSGNFSNNVAASLGGAAIALTDSTPANSDLGWRVQPVNKPATKTVYTDVYCCNFNAAANWATALGIGGFTAVSADAQARMAVSDDAGVTAAGYFQDAPGVYDARYCIGSAYV